MKTEITLEEELKAARKEIEELKKLLKEGKRRYDVLLATERNILVEAYSPDEAEELAIEEMLAIDEELSANQIEILQIDMV